MLDRVAFGVAGRRIHVAARSQRNKITHGTRVSNLHGKEGKRTTKDCLDADRDLMRARFSHDKMEREREREREREDKAFSGATPCSLLLRGHASLVRTYVVVHPLLITRSTTKQSRRDSIFAIEMSEKNRRGRISKQEKEREREREGERERERERGRGRERRKYIQAACCN